MKLKELLNEINCILFTSDEVEVENITFKDSEVRKGSLYVCLKGENVDGHDFADKAISRGAVAVVCERMLNVKNEIVVEDTRKALAKLCANFYGNPSRKMKMIAVTGTNGKTTSTYILKSILDNAGIKCGVIGTNGIYYLDKKIESSMTTPDPTILHKALYEMQKDGVLVCVMEASSHALFYDKLHGINFDVSIFTNLSQDHLDFFKTMDNLGRAKLKLFENDVTRIAVINKDDEFSKVIEFFSKSMIFDYSIKEKADVYLIKSKDKKSKNGLYISAFGQNMYVETNLLGGYNIQNLLGVLSVAKLLGIKDANIKQGLKKVLVEGRFNTYRLKNGATVVIDYAHTPDGMKNVLSECRSLCKKDLICVFGCGGNRDRSKRKEMGEIATKFADKVIITSDNPRFENPLDIINDICVGVCNLDNIIREVDRKKAISIAIENSKKGDFIALLGKGAENYLDINGEKLEYSDYAEIKRYIKGDRNE